MPPIQPQKSAPAHPAPVASRRPPPGLLTAIAVLWTMAAAWLSQGTVAYGDAGVSRLGMLPVTPAALILVVFAGALAAGLVRAGASRLPLSLLVLAMLPWLPMPVPAAMLLWTSPLVAVVWAGVFIGMIATVPWRAIALPASVDFSIGVIPGWHATIFPPHLAVRAALLALAIYSAAAWAVAPSRPGGDEPHYLIITQSLLRDHDLAIENNHARGDYREYFAGDLSKPDYLRRGRNGAIYSIHAPGLPALVAPAFLVGGYRGVIVFLLLVSSIAAGLAFELSRRVTGSTTAAWFGWAALVLAPTQLLNAFTVYPDGPAGLLVLTGVWALIRAREEQASEADAAWPWLLHGVALALLPWLHTRFALLAGGIGALVLLALARTRNPAAKATAFLIVPSLSALAWMAFFIAIYGAPDPSIPYRGSDLGAPAYIPGGMGGLFFDQMYGLFVNAPALIAVPIGMIALAWKRGPYRLLPAQLAFIALPYVVTVTHFAMWWGGYSSPARFLLPLLPSCAIVAAAAWAAAGARSGRVLLSASLVVTGALAVLLTVIDRGRLAYFDRGNVYGLWAEFVSRTADLAHGLPAYFARVQRQRPGELFFLEIVVWVATIAAACAATSLMIRRVERISARPTGRGGAVTLAGALLALAVMTAVALVWRMEGVDGRLPAAAAMNLLRQAGAVDRAVPFDLTGRSRLTTGALIGRMDLRLARTPRSAPLREDRALFTLPVVPAGDYRLRTEGTGGAGWLMAGVGAGRDQFALVTEPVGVFDAEIAVRFPVDVRALVVRGDEDAAATVRALDVRAVSLRSGGAKVSDGIARRAVRYGATAAFFMDERAFPEPAGFWIGGARETAVAFQPDEARAAVTLLIRNGPLDNVVTLASAAWRESLRLAPGEERGVEVPIGRDSGAALVTFTSASGFRPGDVNPGSRDTRFLGAWVAIR